MRIPAIVAALSLTGLVAAGCTTDESNKAAQGALIGGVGAAAVTAIITGDAESTLIAAAAGAAAGAVIGYASADKRQCWYADGRGGYYKGRC